MQAADGLVIWNLQPAACSTPSHPGTDRLALPPAHPPSENSAKGLRMVKGRCIKPHRPVKHCRKGYKLVKGRCVRPQPVKHCRKGYKLVKGKCVGKRY